MAAAHDIRIELARLGWNTEDRLSDFGWGTNDERGYSAWVERWDWHGVNLGNKVSFGSSVKPADLTPEAIDRAWERCRELAVAAWRDFPQSIPTQDIGGALIEDVSMTKILINVYKGNPWLAESKHVQD